MITTIKVNNVYASSGQPVCVTELVGLSTDTKPTNVGNGSTFVEMDTQKFYIFNATGEAWVEQ